MTTDTNQVNFQNTEQKHSITAKAGYFTRHFLEMSAAMFIEAILLIGVAQFGILQRSSLVPWLHYLMMPAMLVPMFLRFDLYSGHHESHQPKACH